MKHSRRVVSDNALQAGVYAAAARVATGAVAPAACWGTHQQSITAQASTRRVNYEKYVTALRILKPNKVLRIPAEEHIPQWWH